jgi:hypothetical protein
VIAYDYETYYDDEVSLKPLGTWQYTQHPETRPYLVSFYGRDANGDSVQFTGDPKDAPWEKLRSVPNVVHNGMFETCCNHRLVQDGIAPAEILDHEMIDTADMCRWLQAPPNLNKASKALLGWEMSKKIRDTNMKGTRWVDIPPSERELWLKYAIDDSRYTYELAHRFAHHWPAKERLLSWHTRVRGIEGVRVNRAQLEQNVSVLEIALHRIRQDMPWVRDDGMKPLSPKGVALACRREGVPTPISLAVDNEDADAWCEKYGAKFPFIAMVRDFRKLNRLSKLCQSMVARCGDSDIMPFELKYCGATHTKRWSGAGGVNMQNPNKDAVWLDKEYRIVSDETRCHEINIRKCIIPREGKKFITADLSQIEPRCLAYLAGDTEYLDLVRSGIDCYEAYARARGLYTRPEPLKDYDPKLRQYYKVCVLQLGYQSGAPKFMNTAGKYGVILDLKGAKAAVHEYRVNQTKVTGYWRKLEREFQSCKGGDYVGEIPSGDVIQYFDVKSQRGWQARKVIDAHYEHYYGGKLTENRTQMMARFVFVEGLLSMEANDFPVLWHTHDEATTEVDVDVNPKDVEEALAVTPDWAPGLPVEAEAQEGDHYVK